MLMISKQVAVAVLALAPALSLSATIYRWVDDQGRTHLSDSVPERYESKAIKIDSKQFELPASERAAAAARLARERAQRAQAADAQARATATAASAPAQAASNATQSPASYGAGTECDRLWQAYHESQACFAPYQSRHRGTKAEAFESCKPVENPSQRCGPAKLR